MEDTQILTAILQAIVVVIPVWITLCVYLLRQAPISYDKYGVLLGSLLSIGFFQIIRMMNIITGYISPTADNSAGDASIRLILRLDEFLIISWFLIMTILFLRVLDDLDTEIMLDFEISDLLSVSTLMKLVGGLFSYLMWIGAIFLCTSIILLIGARIVS